MDTQAHTDANAALDLILSLWTTADWRMLNRHYIAIRNIKRELEA
jgi:hypothetical protein